MVPHSTNSSTHVGLLKQNRRIARQLWGDSLSSASLEQLRELSDTLQLSILRGDLILISGSFYITHAGLLRIARTQRCKGIHTSLIQPLCNISERRYTFVATVFTNTGSEGFMGYGDADPFNVSPFVHGAEMRIAETRAVNRALRKAYGIGICSVEEIGSTAPTSKTAEREIRKLPPDVVNGNRNNGHRINGSANGIRVRDRLCQVIRQHGLDADLVKAYAIDFCGTKSLREASREQVENFVAHLADWAEKDRNSLLCQLNSYSRPQAGAA